ncbi:cobyrinate a,c-diamide synthase [Desulfovibrio sp. TomC]|uniref:cobyrinate a,c-diamide synthase n=1 Tax=Desulfovibrio sp. TomC TaxID=1562888 RepID=UPI000574C676|nr:cobyrinate a,c-diamide synthase [Desulfovibrio sp. TomC]KHK02118.1 Cobyrinic acid A,C-diamide synthase [Desulfovibrio sp. TomC]
MNDRPRLVLAGLSGGAGKTILSLGICRALATAGLRVRPFKKGPDYIDAAWLGLAAGHDATNLDPFLLPPERIPSLFLEKSAGGDISIIEGNRGIFDGMDVAGSCSTAALARSLTAPVVLILDATKMTRTAAAIVAGVAGFEPGLNLAGVVLNRTAGPRHRDILREAIETLAGVPVLGLLPKIAVNPIPERHMGLVSNREQDAVDPILDGIAAIIRDNVDLDRLLAIARSAPALAEAAPPAWPAPRGDGTRPVIGVVRDAALWFYYPENLEALERAGARLVNVSILDAAPWPELDGLYLGGGFPETQVEALAANAVVRNRVRDLSADGLPIYAECGGFMYLCQGLDVAGTVYPMAGVFPVTTTLCARPQGLGYSVARVVRENPYHPVGTVLRGHEFHYSKCQAALGACAGSGGPGLPGAESFALAMERGVGMLDGLDGLVTANTFAAYTHIHADGAPHWADHFVAAALARCAAKG